MVASHQCQRTGHIARNCPQNAASTSASAPAAAPGPVTDDYADDDLMDMAIEGEEPAYVEDLIDVGIEGEYPVCEANQGGKAATSS